MKKTLLTTAIAIALGMFGQAWADQTNEAATGGTAANDEGVAVVVEDTLNENFQTNTNRDNKYEDNFQNNSNQDNEYHANSHNSATVGDVLSGNTNTATLDNRQTFTNEQSWDARWEANWDASTDVSLDLSGQVGVEILEASVSNLSVTQNNGGFKPENKIDDGVANNAGIVQVAQNAGAASVIQQNVAVQAQFNDLNMGN